MTDSVSLSETGCDKKRLSVSVTDSLFLSQTVFVCQRQLLSVTEKLCMCLWQTACVCHRQSLLYRQSVFVTDSLSLSHKFFFSFSFIKHSSWSLYCLSDVFLIYTAFSSRFVNEISVCPGFKSYQDRLCGPLHIGRRRKYFILCSSHCIMQQFVICSMVSSVYLTDPV